MLKPAILYKEEILEKFKECVYSEDYFLYAGYAHSHELPCLDLKDNVYQYAMVDKEDKLIGYFAYQVQPETDTVLNFGLYSFDRGNPLVGLDLFNKMEELVNTYRRVEWRVIGGNPVIRHYDKFCKKHNGNKVTLHNVTRDLQGNFRDESIYEILRDMKDISDEHTQEL